MKGEELFEIWENERYRLDAIEWSTPYMRPNPNPHLNLTPEPNPNPYINVPDPKNYMRGHWTTRDGQLIFSRLNSKTPPESFQCGAERKSQP